MAPDLRILVYHLTLAPLSEYTFITAPVTVTGENGEVIQQAIVQQVGTSEQENIDPSSQVSADF